MKGEAEAFAVEAKAKAEAEQMARKAEAWKQYEDAAVVDMVLEMLPKVLPSLSNILLLLQPFYGSLDFVRNNTGELVPEETFTHSHI